MKKRPKTRFYTKKGKSYVRRKGKVYRLKEVRPFFKEPTNWLIFILILIIIVLLVNQNGNSNQSAMNFSDSKEQSSSQSTSSFSSEETIDTVELEEDLEIPYGEAGESEGLSLTINEVTETDSISAVGGFSTYTPEEGAKYALINIKLKNVGNESVSTSNGWFKLVSGETIYSPSTMIVTGTDQNFITFESINPGLEQNGYLAFEVPQDLDISSATLRFDGTGIFEDSLIFLLK